MFNEALSSYSNYFSVILVLWYGNHWMLINRGRLLCLKKHYQVTHFSVILVSGEIAYSLASVLSSFYNTFPCNINQF